MLGPEMKSTAGMASTTPTRARCGLIGAGMAPPPPAADVPRSPTRRSRTRLHRSHICEMDYHIYATPGTWKLLNESGIVAERVNKIRGIAARHRSHMDNGVDLSRNVTPRIRRRRHGHRIRRASVEVGVACLVLIPFVRSRGARRADGCRTVGARCKTTSARCSLSTDLYGRPGLYV